jgi:tetratricopeptide (TPR) repeat protein
MLALALATLAASSCGKTRAKTKEKTYPVAGVIVETSGEADIRPAGTYYWLPGAAGSAVMYGDSVSKGRGGGLVMVLAAGGLLRAGEATDFALDKGALGALAIDLWRGSSALELQAGTSAEIKTPAATITSAKSAGKSESCVLDVRAEPSGPTTLTVIKGSAKMEGAGSVTTVQAPNQSVCEQGKQPSKPSKVQADVPAGGFAFLAGLQTAKYFRNEATRDKTEDDARSKIAVDPGEAWSYVNLGRALLDKGDTNAADTAFRKALEIKPGFSQALAGLGRAALLTGRWDEAADFYEQARLADGESLDALLGTADSALGAGKLQDAVKRYKDTLEVDQQSQSALTGLAIVKMLQGETDIAADDLARAIEVEPAHTAALQVQACVYALGGNLGQAVACLKRAIDSSPDDYRVRSAIADMYFVTGLDDPAHLAYKRLADSEDRPLMVSGFQGMGCVAEATGDVKGAIGDWTKAQELIPDRSAILENLGQAQLIAGDPAAAIAALSKAVSADGTDWFARELLARAFLAAGENTRAVDQARVAAGLAPGEWSTHLVLGLALDACGSKDQGATELDRALALKPKEKLPAAEHALLAEAFKRQGKSAEALSEYRQAQALAPGDGTYHRLAGEMLTELKRTSEALSEYRKAIQASPGDVLSQVRYAEALYASGQKDEAIKALQTAVRQNPNDADPRRLLGQYLLNDNDVEGALFQLDAAVGTPGTRPDLLAASLITRGNAKDRKEDFAGAIEDYSRAISTDPGRGDAWFYLAGDLERTGKVADARTAYANAAQLCGPRPEWKKFYEEASARLAQLDAR